MVMEMHRQIARMHDVQDAPAPFDAAYMDWSVDPYRRRRALLEPRLQVVGSPRADDAAGAPTSPATSAARPTRRTRPGWRARCRPRRSCCRSTSAWRSRRGSRDPDSCRGARKAADARGRRKQVDAVARAGIPEPGDQQPRIIGLGYSVPPSRRTNDDPIFDWLKAHVPPDEQSVPGIQDPRRSRTRRGSDDDDAAGGDERAAGRRAASRRTSICCSGTRR